MGLFDGLVATTFRRDAGRVYFVPWGRWGRSYLVPPEREAHLTRFLRAYYAAMFPLILAATFVFQWRAMLLAPLFSGALYLKFWHFTRGLPVAESAPPVDRGELLRQHARATGKPVLWFSLAASLLLVAVGLWLLSRGERSGTTYFTIVFFGLCAAVNVMQLRKAR